MSDEILEEEGIDPNDVVLKGYSGTDTRYENVPKIWLTSADGESKVPFSYGEAVENVPIELVDLSSGSQTVVAPEGTLVKSAVIQKPDSLVPANVAKGVEIAGVTGEFVGDVEEQTVELEMPYGDLVIRPSADDKVLTKVTVTKPAELIPENIRYGIELAGVAGSYIGDTEEVTVDLNMVDGDQVVIPSDESKVLKKVTIVKPATLVPDNIAKGIVIAGIVGTHSGGASLDSVELRYLAYNIATDVNAITLYKILYDKVYTVAGSNDVVIPDQLGGYDVIIVCE